jgi:hypothetical protein
MAALADRGHPPAGGPRARRLSLRALALHGGRRARRVRRPSRDGHAPERADAGRGPPRPGPRRRRPRDRAAAGQPSRRGVAAAADDAGGGRAAAAALAPRPAPPRPGPHARRWPRRGGRGGRAAGPRRPRGPRGDAGGRRAAGGLGDGHARGRLARHTHGGVLSGVAGERVDGPALRAGAVDQPGEPHAGTRGRGRAAVAPRADRRPSRRRSGPPARGRAGPRHPARRLRRAARPVRRARRGRAGGTSRTRRGASPIIRSRGLRPPNSPADAARSLVAAFPQGSDCAGGARARTTEDGRASGGRS